MVAGEWRAVAEAIGRARNSPFTLQSARPVGGGCINQAVELIGDQGRFFVKTNTPERLAMFEAEAEGLAELAASDSIRVPRPVVCGRTADFSYLVLEWLDFGPGGASGDELAGQQLAQLHHHTRRHFGWHRDNTIGATAQHNDEQPDWVAFFRERRLGFQLQLAARNGYGGPLQRDAEQLLARLDGFFDHSPQASLLHGDLWGGNIGYLSDGTPVIFDPAVYYGDREADLAMTELFGGFSGRFYAAYNEAWPLAAGYTTRKTLYNLYHILNHLNLFGGGYLGQAQRMIQQLLAACR